MYKKSFYAVVAALMFFNHALYASDIETFIKENNSGWALNVVYDPLLSGPLGLGASANVRWTDHYFGELYMGSASGHFAISLDVAQFAWFFGEHAVLFRAGFGCPLIGVKGVNRSGTLRAVWAMSPQAIAGVDIALTDNRDMYMFIQTKPGMLITFESAVRIGYSMPFSLGFGVKRNK